MNTLFSCPWEGAQYLIYSKNVPALLYYSHIPSVIIALLLGFWVLNKGEKSLITKVLFLITFLFSLWCTFDLVLWATNDPRVVMFFWSLQVLIEPLTYALSIYLSYLFMKGKDMIFSGKLLMTILLLPFILFLSHHFSITGVNLVDCTAIEGPVSLYYSYIYEIISVLVVLEIFVSAHATLKDSIKKREITYFMVGMIMFLLAFSWGNLIGSFTENWTLAQAGLIGMPIFFGFLAFISVKFKSFNLKILGAQVLIVALGVLVLSIAFLKDIENARLIVALTLLIILILGRTLIRLVKLEVRQRERLEMLRLKLEESNTTIERANDRLTGLDKLKTEFVSLASHQLRTPLTAIKGYSSMVLEGDFGEINDKAKDAISRIFESTMNLTKIVEDLLNVSKIEQGGMKYEMMSFDLGEVTHDVVGDLTIPAEKKGLLLSFKSESTSPYIITGDKEKIRQVILNLVDNAIKYTKEGSVNVSLSTVGTMVRFTVKDTGMGISNEIQSELFEKFSRGEGARVNANGSGLGLYLAKEIIEAHKGNISIHSDGIGKGSTFSFDLALQNN